ncbi:MAG: hypothetical protein ACYTXA_06505 [Nostoc sp.]
MPNTSLPEAALRQGSVTTPTTSLRDATRTLLLYERLRQRRRSVQVSTSAQCPMPSLYNFRYYCHKYI